MEMLRAFYKDCINTQSDCTPFDELIPEDIKALENSVAFARYRLQASVDSFMASCLKSLKGLFRA